MTVPVHFARAMMLASVAAAASCPSGFNRMKNTCFTISGTKFIRNFSAETVEDCCAACGQQDGCTSFEWNVPGTDSNGWPGVDKQCNLIEGYPSVKKPKKPTQKACIAGQYLQPPPPPPVPPPKGAKNVLYIVVDDLRTQMEHYGHAFMKTPHLSAFAESTGTLTFRQAHVQSQMCVPTRNSFLTGRRPQTTKVFNDGVGNHDFRVAGKKWTTLPQHFKASGWFATGVGKIFHPNSPPNFDQPMSWSNLTGWEFYSPPAGNCPTATDVWCNVPDSEQFEDEMSLNEATRRLKLLAEHRNQTGQPFFLAAGFHKPHTPYRAPQRFFDMYPLEDKIEIAKHPEFPTDQNLTGLSWFSCKAEGNQYPIVHTSNYPISIQQKLRRAYYAAVSFTDSNIGSLLSTLESLGISDDTLVTLHGDHGYQLGEFNVFCKETNFNRATHVPLMVRVPWLKSIPKGAQTNAMIELVDLYPTLVDLAGAPALDPTQTGEPDLEGKSFSSVLEAVNSGRPYDKAKFNYSFSQYSRHRCFDDFFENKPKRCSGGANNMGHFTGYSVRSPHWRYTRWTNVTVQGIPMWNQVFSEELYFYESPAVNDFDSSDLVNLAYHPEQAHNLKDMRRVLRKGFSKWIPGCNMMSSGSEQSLLV